MPAPNAPPLNPNVYLNHLSPTEAHEIDVRTDITLIVLGAILWDIFTYFPSDLEIVWQNRLTLVKGCFMCARLFATGHVFLVVMGNDRNRNWTYILSGCMCLLSMMSSSFLFLQRVLAVYYDNKRVRRGFCILWVLVSLTDIVIPFGGHQNNIPGTNKYQDSSLQPWVSISVWSVFLFDSSVIIAVSYKILLTCSIFKENKALSWYNLFTGRTLPEFSRAIFRGGVQYYAITVGVVLLGGFALAVPSVPQIYKVMVPSAMVPLMASMACRVFRNTKLFYSEGFLMETL